MNLTIFFRSLSSFATFSICFILILVVGVFDVLTGAEISFSIFYLVPVALAVWFSGKRVGLSVALLAAIAWLVADLMSGAVYSHPIIPYWNATVRLGFFVIVGFSLLSVRKNQARREELVEFIFHDLRAPLSNAIAGLQAVLEHPRGSSEANDKDILNMCLISCNRMGTLIQSLLDLAKLEAGQLTLNPEDTNVLQLLESSRNQVSVWATRRQVTVSLQADANVRSVFADPLVTERVLVNLLTNAIKHSRPDASVAITVMPAGSEMVAFHVADRGSGIPKEWTDNVFRKWAQVDLSKMGSEVGVGLGLTFCRLAIEAQGGTIHLASEIDKGTTVTFTLPSRPR